MPRQTNANLAKCQKGFNRSLEEHREIVKSLRPTASPADENVECQEMYVPWQNDHRLPVKIYRHRQAKNISALPTFIYLPGTGFVAAETEFTHVICTRMVETLKTWQVIVFLPSLLAPEYKFEQIINGHYAMLKHILQAPLKSFNVDCNHVAMGGYSSGGYFAAMLAIQAKKDKLPIHFQLLISPLLDLTRSLYENPKYRRFLAAQEQDKCVSEEFTQWVITHYLSDGTDPRSASPYWKEKSDIKGLPPTYIMYGQNDRCGIDARAYKDKLEEASVSTRQIILLNQDHAFWWHNMDAVVMAAMILKTFFANSLKYKKQVSSFL